jgi:hypothetical protein
MEPDAYLVKKAAEKLEPELRGHGKGSRRRGDHLDIHNMPFALLQFNNNIRTDRQYSKGCPIKQAEPR